MASRSFKPASYLASAQAHTQQAQAQAQAQSSRRPSFARTSSSSSTHSTKSDDSFLATLRTLKTGSNRKEGEFGSSGRNNSGGGVSPRCHTPGTPQPLFFDETPGRKRSDPISIKLPTKNHQQAYTPLSARGDLPGGYFPNHETIQRQYNSHPFSKRQQSPDSPTMSKNSSALVSPCDDHTPRAPVPLAFQPTFPAPETLTMPKGRYHPSNYKIASPTPPSAPPSAPVTHASLEIPSAKKKQRPSHQRQSSDIKRKLQQYQRDMIAQARLASTSQDGPPRAKPDSPKLLPLASPGPITPFELEETAGYMVAGTRTGALGLEREREMVGRMIRQEEQRIGARDGSGSPVLI